MKLKPIDEELYQAHALAWIEQTQMQLSRTTKEIYDACEGDEETGYAANWLETAEVLGIGPDSAGWDNALAAKYVVVERVRQLLSNPDGIRRRSVIDVFNQLVNSINDE